MVKRVDQKSGRYVVATEIPSERRERILTVALHLFTSRGYFNTSVHDIQRVAEVSIGSIYHHFGNKEAIAKALLNYLEQEMYEKIAAITNDCAGTAERCRAVIAYLFEATETEPEKMQYMLYARHREFLPDEKPVCSSRPFTLMKDMVIEGIDRGDIRALDVNVAAVSIFGGAIRLIFLRLDGVLENRLENYLDECWDCAWRSVRADG